MSQETFTAAFILRVRTALYTELSNTRLWI